MGSYLSRQPIHIPNAADAYVQSRYPSVLKENQQYETCKHKIHQAIAQGATATVCDDNIGVDNQNKLKELGYHIENVRDPDYGCYLYIKWDRQNPS
jgi:hypothetical protein